MTTIVLIALSVLVICSFTKEVGAAIGALIALLVVCVRCAPLLFIGYLVVDYFVTKL